MKILHAMHAKNKKANLVLTDFEISYAQKSKKILSVLLNNTFFLSPYFGHTTHFAYHHILVAKTIFKPLNYSGFSY